MATAPWSGFSFDGDEVTGTINYDTVSFAAVSVSYQNLSAQDASVTITSPTGTTILTLAAGTQPTSKPITSLGLTMDHFVATNPKTHLQQTFVNLPPGWQISTAWPAS